MPTLKTLLLSLTACIAFSGLCQAQDMDVDQADSLDFEAFHKEKKDAVKLWDDKKPEKAYDEKSDNTGEAKSDDTAATQSSGKTGSDKSGKRYEIRELYSITGSDRTGYNPTTVVQALYLQMQGLCPKGWNKLDERSVPNGKDAFYMYYIFECL